MSGTSKNHSSYQVKQAFLPLLILAALSGTGSVMASTVVPHIQGVTAPDTALEFIKAGFEGTEGPIAAPDGSLLFTETRANRITKISSDNQISTFLEQSNGSNGLAFSPSGELISVQVADSRVGVIYPKEKTKVLAADFHGKKFQRPNDLVLAKNGGVYFTDSGSAGTEQKPDQPRTAVYYIDPKGKTHQVIAENQLKRPNGIQLSRDEKTLYVANTGGEYVLAYPVNSDGTLGQGKDFAKLRDGLQKGENGNWSSGADGLAVDEQGRLYVTSNAGVEVFDQAGKALGVIPVPHKPQNLAFAGKDKKTLYIVGRGAAYRLPVLTAGFSGRVK